MLRRLGTLIGTLLVTATVGATVPVAPASADTAVCVGQGSMITGPLWHSGLQASGVLEIPPMADTVGYSFGLDVGGCAHQDGVVTTTLYGAGVITGWCDTSTGLGEFRGHHYYAHTNAGSFWLITPQSPWQSSGTAVGLAQVLPDFTMGQSCFSGSTRFLVTGAVALV